jgi:hypothetical protein
MITAMPGVQKAIDENRVRILGAVCETETGRVRFLKDREHACD